MKLLSSAESEPERAPTKFFQSSSEMNSDIPSGSTPFSLPSNVSNDRSPEEPNTLAMPSTSESLPPVKNSIAPERPETRFFPVVVSFSTPLSSSPLTAFVIAPPTCSGAPENKPPTSEMPALAIRMPPLSFTMSLTDFCLTPSTALLISLAGSLAFLRMPNERPSIKYPPIRSNNLLGLLVSVATRTVNSRLSAIFCICSISLFIILPTSTIRCLKSSSLAVPVIDCMMEPIPPKAWAIILAFSTSKFSNDINENSVMKFSRAYVGSFACPIMAIALANMLAISAAILAFSIFFGSEKSLKFEEKVLTALANTMENSSKFFLSGPVRSSH